MAFITAETRSDLIALAVGMLKQAPSNSLLDELIALSVEGGSLAEAADHIAKTDAFKAEYPSFQTAEQYATEIFDNITTGGTVTAEIRTAVIELATGFLTSGEFSKSGLAQAIVDFLSQPAALLNDDFADIAQSVQNRSAAAEYFVVTKELGGSTDAELAAAIASVTSDADTLTAAKEAADTTADAEEVVPGQTFTLTTGVDNLVGTADDNVITAAAGTFGAGDTIAAGEGTDTLNVTLTGTGPTQSATSMTGVEILNITASPNPASLNLTGVTGLTEVNNASSANGATLAVSNLGNAVDTTITGTNTSTTIGYTTAVTAATAVSDSSKLTLAGTQLGSSFVTAGIETLTVDSTTSANVLSALSATGVKSVTITGDQDLTVKGTVGGKTLTTLDASAATGAITIATGNGTSSATDLTGITVTAPTSADAGLFTVTTNSNKDVVTLGGGDAVVSTGGGADTITSSTGDSTITPGAGNDTLTLGAGVDTVRFDTAAGATNSDTITGFAADDVLSINLGTAQVTGANPVAANPVYGSLLTTAGVAATSPTFAGVSGLGTGTGIVFQEVSPGVATANTIAQASNVVVLNGVFSDGTAAGVVNALGATGTTGITTQADSRFLLVTHSVGNVAQVWSYTGDSQTAAAGTSVLTDIDAAELQLVATLNGVVAGSLTAANFSTYLDTVAAPTTVSAGTGQTVNLTGTLNTVQSEANAAGQYLTAANDTINVGVGTLPTAVRSATAGLTIIDPSTSDADVMNATVLGAGWDLGTTISSIETVNLNMLVLDNDGFSASAVLPGTSKFVFTGAADMGTAGARITALPAATTIGFGAGASNDVFGIQTTAGAFTVALTGSGVAPAGATAAARAVAAPTVPTLDMSGGTTSTITVSGTSYLGTQDATTSFFGAPASASTITGSGNLTISGTAATFSAQAGGASATQYTGTLTLRPDANGAIDLSGTGADTSAFIGVDAIDLSQVTGFNGAISFAATNGTGPVTVSSANTLGAMVITKDGSGLTDSLVFAPLNTVTSLNATGFENVTVSLGGTAGVTAAKAITNIQLSSGAGNQAVTVASNAAATTLGIVTADSLNTAGLVGSVTATLANGASGVSFTGSSTQRSFITGSTGADIITTGSGNDAIYLPATSANDLLTGGLGSDTYSTASTDSGGMVITDAGGAVDTLFLSGTAADIAGVNSGASLTTIGIEQLIIPDNVGVITVASGQLGAQAINAVGAAVDATAAAEFTLESTVDGGILNVSGLVVTALAAGTYLDAAGAPTTAAGTAIATFTLVGSGQADTITGSALPDTITGGLGADAINGGLGIDTFVYNTVDTSTATALDAISGVVNTEIISFDTSADSNTTDDAAVAGNQANEFANGMATGTLATNIAADTTFTDALTEFLAAASFLDDDVAGFVFGGDSYIVHADANNAAGNVVRLVGVTVTAIAESATTDTFVLTI